MSSASGEIVERLARCSRRPEDRRCRSAARRGRAAARRAPPRRPCVTSTCWRSGSFSTTSMRPVASLLRTASPISGWWSSTTLATSPSVSAGPRRIVSSIGTLARSAGVDDRRDVLDAEPLVGRVDEPAGAGRRCLQEVSGETHSALPVVSMTCSSETFLSSQLLRDRPGPAAAARAGPRWPRWPRRARPSGAAGSSSGPARRSRSSDSSFEESPIIMTRLVDDGGCSICGGCDTSAARPPG